MSYAVNPEAVNVSPSILRCILREEMAKQGTCPECLGEMDHHQKCASCGYMILEERYGRKDERVIPQKPSHQ